MNLHDLIIQFLGRLLGLDETQAIDNYDLAFGAPWAQNAAGWLLLGCLALIVTSAVYYLHYQRTRNLGARIFLTVVRAAALCAVLLLVAEPILRVTEASRKRPLLWLLFDGTDSMAINDELPSAVRNPLNEAVGLKDPVAAKEPPERSRADYVRALVANPHGNLLQQLAKNFRLQAFLFENARGIRSLEMAEGGKPGIEPKYLAGQLKTAGKVTAIGSAFSDLAQRHATSNLGAVVVFSDFNQNAGMPAVEAAKRLGVPVHTVGVGATTAADVSVDLQAPLRMKKDESTNVSVTLRQEGLDGAQVHMHLTAEPLGGVKDAGPAGPSTSAPLPEGEGRKRTTIADRTVTLVSRSQTVEIPYTPDRAGRFLLAAEVDPVPGEIVRENNRATREVVVLDSVMRLMFVEYEPTWEWRFIKEVFYRDKLVGQEGFRTFLFSSDPRVRREGQLFLPTLTPPRNEFFVHDVIFLGDVPSSGLSPRFCEMTKEFVGDFGGGLVVLSGPRFGPQQLANTPLLEMLPVVPDLGGGPSDRQPFRLKLTPMAGLYDFMKLGADDQENKLAWDNLGPLPWYQPVRRKHPQADVLAEHPTAMCVDGKERQPLIAIRKYGRGEVIYLAFNETWRMRKKYGERYFRQFWGQMIQRLSLNHALGDQKRFVVRTDRHSYRADDQVILTVEAYNADFKPLSEKDLLSQKLEGELTLPAETAGHPGGTQYPGSGSSPAVQRLTVPLVKPGIFETKFPVYASGEHRLRVTNPLTNKLEAVTFQVITTPVERQRPVRNVALQEAIAAETGGKTYDLASVAGLVEDIRIAPKIEKTVEVVTLTFTWLGFALVAGLLLCEWLVRKWVNLP